MPADASWTCWEIQQDFPNALCHTLLVLPYKGEIPVFWNGVSINIYTPIVTWNDQSTNRIVCTNLGNKADTVGFILEQEYGLEQNYCLSIICDQWSTKGSPWKHRCELNSSVIVSHYRQADLRAVSEYLLTALVILFTEMQDYIIKDYISKIVHKH